MTIFNSYVSHSEAKSPTFSSDFGIPIPIPIPMGSEFQKKNVQKHFGFHPEIRQLRSCRQRDASRVVRKHALMEVSGEVIPKYGMLPYIGYEPPIGDSWEIYDIYI